MSQVVENECTNSLVNKDESTPDKNKPEENQNATEQKLTAVKNDSQQINDLKIKMDNMAIKIENLQHDLQMRTEEKENYKNKIHQLETELKNVQMNSISTAQQNEIEKMKKQSEEMLVKAKGVIFEKTKLCKNQELKIEALTQQVDSLKEVLNITKGLLEIRNMEVKHLEEQMNNMEVKIKTERHRFDLLNQKSQAMSELNATLRKEYETQLQLFNELRAQYAERDRLMKSTN